MQYEYKLKQNFHLLELETLDTLLDTLHSLLNSKYLWKKNEGLTKDESITNNIGLKKTVKNSNLN